MASITPTSRTKVPLNRQKISDVIDSPVTVVETTAERPSGLGVSDIGTLVWDKQTKNLVTWTGTEWSDEDEP